jgi:hypothetical protein
MTPKYSRKSFDKLKKLKNLGPVTLYRSNAYRPNDPVRLVPSSIGVMPEEQMTVSRTNVSQTNVSRTNVSWPNVSRTNASRTNVSWTNVSQPNVSQP